MELPIVFVLCSSFQIIYSANLITNGNFEESITSSNWFCLNCTMTTSNDCYHGNTSVLISNSLSKHFGPGQTIRVIPRSRYALSGFVKLLNVSPGQMFNRIEMVVKLMRNSSLPHPRPNNCTDAIAQCQLIPNACDDVTVARSICRQFCAQCDPDIIWVGTNPMTQVENGWQEIGGDILVPSDTTTLSVYFRIYGSNASYLLDLVKVEPIADMLNWKNLAKARIDQIRKSNIHISVIGGRDGDPVEIDVMQTNHGFPFGTAVTALGITNTSYSKYQEFVYNNFNWAVLENALKWSNTEKMQGMVDYSTAKTALEKLLKKGLRVRGHTVFWDVPAWGIQPWVAMLNKEQLIQAMEKRYKVVNITRGKVSHWDVNNENQHGQFYEMKLGDPNITAKMFERVHSIDPNVNLFLNDFDVVLKHSSATTSFKNQGKWLHDTGIPIYGMGIQSHLTFIDLPGIKYRLDKVAEAGLPIWITELSYNQPDKQIRARDLEDVMTLYFSHPAVEGILLWGFWDQMIFQPNAAIVEGQELTPNEAGRRILHLLNNEWKTDVTTTVAVNSPVTVRGFHGNYTLRVKMDGIVVKTETFDLDRSGQSITINLHRNIGDTEPLSVILG